MKASSLEPAKDFKLLSERPIDALGLHMDAKQKVGDCHDYLYGYSHEIQRQYRQGILQASVEDVLRVGAEYLKP